MQLIKNKQSIDLKNVEQILIRENKYINDLFSSICIPLRNEEEDDSHNDKKQKLPHISNSQPRAKSLVELQDRLKAVTSKKRLTYKEKLAKKGLKNRMKKKSKQDERNAQQKRMRAEKAMMTVATQSGDNTEEPKHSESATHCEGKMVFSKFDFSNLGVRKNKKQEKDPKKLLENIEKQKEKINQLTESGEVEKALQIKEKNAWKNALAKADGIKVKDDPMLLKKTMQRKEQKQRSSKKKWQARQENVKKMQDDRQNKRNENIQKRKKEKKVNKLKKAAKKGKIIPGF